jgi:hypothetical protein
MSILYDIAVNRLWPSAARIRESQTFGIHNRHLVDGRGHPMGPTVEQFLYAVATLEVGLQLGLPSPFRDTDLSSLGEVLSYETVKNYRIAHRLELPARFEQRLTSSSLSRSDDGSSNVLFIDDSLHREHVLYAFSDLILIGNSLRENWFVRTARGRLEDFAEEDIGDEDLVTALRILVDQRGEFVRDPFSRAHEIARLVEAMQDLEFQVAELDDVTTSIYSLSAHGEATRDLVSSHLLPDAARLADMYRTFSEALRMGIERQFAVSARNTSSVRLFVKEKPVVGLDSDVEFEIATDRLTGGGSGLLSDRADLDSFLIARIEKATKFAEMMVGQFARQRDIVVSMQSGTDAREEATRLRLQRLRFL